MTHPIDTSPEAIAALLDGVTPGPWKYVPNGKKTSITDCDYDRLFIASGTTAPYCDAGFIAAARELVPALAAEIARLTAERDAALIRAERSERAERSAHDAANTAIRHRDEARAQVAMAYAQAANRLETTDAFLFTLGDCATFIRALTPTDASTALARRDAAMRNEGRRQAAAACDWGDIYGDNAVSVILATLEPEGGE